MKRLLIAALALALAAGSSLAGDFVDGQRISTQGQALLGQTFGGVVIADSTGRIWRFTTDGFGKVSLTNGLETQLLSQLIMTDTTAVGIADSLLTPVDTHLYKRLWLTIQVTWPNSVAAPTVTRWTRFAVQVRGHNTATVDSLNTNPWWVYTDSTRTRSFSSGMLTGIGVADTAGYRALEGTGNAVFSYTKLLPTEVGPFYASRAFTTNHLYGEPNNFYIPLADSRGVFFWANYTTIRVRTINNFTTTNTDQPKYIVTLTGTAN